MDQEHAYEKTGPDPNPGAPDRQWSADTGELIDTRAPDPVPEAVEDPDDPSYVAPAHDAVPVNPDLLLPAAPPYESELPTATLSPYMVDVELPEPGAPYPPAVGIASPVGLPPVGTSLPGAPDSLDPERDPEGHA